MEARNTENNQYGRLASANPSRDSALKTANRRTSRERVVIVGWDSMESTRKAEPGTAAKVLSKASGPLVGKLRNDSF
jgi:hypothetical protein